MPDAQLIGKIDAINFSDIREYLKRERGWNAATADMIEGQYRRLFYLRAMYRNEELVPWSELLSEFEQAHVLHTVQYNQNCMDVFGQTVNYHPRLAADLPRKQEQLARVRELHLREFGPQHPKGRKPDGQNDGAESARNSETSSSQLPIWMLAGAGLDFFEHDHHHDEEKDEQSLDFQHEGDVDRESDEDDFDEEDDQDEDDDFDEDDNGDFDDSGDFGDDSGSGGGDGGGD